MAITGWAIFGFLYLTVAAGVWYVFARSRGKTHHRWVVTGIVGSLIWPLLPVYVWCCNKLKTWWLMRKCERLLRSFTDARTAKELTRRIVAGDL
jgi:hypothetical protein